MSKLAALLCGFGTGSGIFRQRGWLDKALQYPTSSLSKFPEQAHYQKTHASSFCLVFLQTRPALLQWWAWRSKHSERTWRPSSCSKSTASSQGGPKLDHTSWWVSPEHCSQSRRRLWFCQLWRWGSNRTISFRSRPQTTPGRRFWIFAEATFWRCRWSCCLCSG